MEVTVTVNGTTQTHDVEPRTLLVHYLPRGLWSDRYERRLRHVVVWSLHRPSRRRVGEVVHGARRAGRRSGRHHHRGLAAATARCTPCSRPSTSATRSSAATARRAWSWRRCRCSTRSPIRARREVRDRSRGQPVPLHGLPQHRQGSPERSGGRRVIPAAFDYVRAGSSTRPSPRSPSTATRPSCIAGWPFAHPSDAFPPRTPAVLIDVGRLEDLSTSATRATTWPSAR